MNVREWRQRTAPSIFTNRNGLFDRYEYVTLSPDEFNRLGGSRGPDGKMWHLNAIIADETGEYIRRPHFTNYRQ